MANLRRSARLSKTAARRRSSTSNNYHAKKDLGPLIEREGTPDTESPAASNVVPSPAPTGMTPSQFAQLSHLTTPSTEPQPGKDEMHPKTVHQTTAKAPDSGLRLGFADINASINHQKTPSKSSPAVVGAPVMRQNMSSTVPSNFQFDFASGSQLSLEAQKLMADVKADAVKIKAQMLADKQREAVRINEDANTRKIATPKGKSSRFSDVHMAQFKKMDSIENHPSAFRGRPGFSAPTSQSLKRKSSRVDLDEPVRPQTAGKGTPRPPQRFAAGQAHSTSPLKRAATSGDIKDGSHSAKRARQTNQQDVSTHHINQLKHVPSTLYSPTKSSMARTGGSQHGSAGKPQILPRSSSIKFAKSPATIRAVSKSSTTQSSQLNFEDKSPARLQNSQSLQFKPLPALPSNEKSRLPQSKSANSFKSPGMTGLAAKFSSFSSLKSILRPGTKDRKDPAASRIQARMTHVQKAGPSPKKVDFTPSVKSRYAVKLAADSPVPAKARQPTPYKAVGPLGVSYDASAYTIAEDELESVESEEEEDVVYPTLPTLSEVSEAAEHTFSAKAKAHNRRESQEFRSIFTDLRPGRTVEATRLTAINTAMNKTNPATYADQVVLPTAESTVSSLPSTIRQVRDSGISNLLEPFNHNIAPASHDSPSKKRRHDSITVDDKTLSRQLAPRNRKSSALPPVPGAWTDTILEDQENEDPIEAESTNRGAKRARKSSAIVMEKSPVKKPNAAREAAAKNAKERKGKGLLSFSRLNILSRPKNKS